MPEAVYGATAALPGAVGAALLWMVAKSILHHERRPWLKPRSMGHLQGNSAETRVSERWCEVDFVHPQYLQLAEVEQVLGGVGRASALQGARKLKL